jgi:hypothetical protein
VVCRLSRNFAALVRPDVVGAAGRADESGTYIAGLPYKVVGGETGGGPGR